MATADGSEKSPEPSTVLFVAADAPRDAFRRTADGLEKSLQASAVDWEAPAPAERPTPARREGRGAAASGSDAGDPGLRGAATYLGAHLS